MGASPASAGEGGREPASCASAQDVLRPNGGDAVPPEKNTARYITLWSASTAIPSASLVMNRSPR